MCANSQVKHTAKNKNGELKFKTIWTTNSGELTVNGYREQNGQGHLEILNNVKSIFLFNPKIFPESFFEMHDGNLATIWYHVNGRKHLYVFAERQGKIRQVLDVDSLLPFEFVFPINNDDFTQRILVADVDWLQVENPKTTKESVRLPKMVDIYKWSDKTQTYDRSTAPWSKKFDHLQLP
jgi:hypothetical protein